MFENTITTPEAINALLPKLYYGDATSDHTQQQFASEMTEQAKSIDFNQQEWNAAMEALQGFSLPDFAEQLSQEQLVESWKRCITANWEHYDLANHFVNQEWLLDKDAHYDFFCKVVDLSHKEMTAVVFVAHNFWTKNDEFLPIFEEIINS